MFHLPSAGYEQDIVDQPDALERCSAEPLPAAIASLDFGRFDRIIMTGMGSSDSVMLPLELVLARRGLPVWRLPTSRLLETPEMITARTLLWITSQSGRSGEVIALIGLLRSGRRCTVVGVTNDAASPLAVGADHVIELLSGREATVSSKSFLNTLAWLHRIAARCEGRHEEEAVAEIRAVAASLREMIDAPPPVIADVARRALAAPSPRLALVGTGADAATALTGALILKEASKVAAEGYSGGAFRHGPMELAGPGLTALLFGTGSREDLTLAQLSRDLVTANSQVIVVAPTGYEGAKHIAVPESSMFARLAHAMVVVQCLSVQIARLAGITPGEFRFGQKITASL